jgi:hypothetical protein
LVRGTVTTEYGRTEEQEEDSPEQQGKPAAGEPVTQLEVELPQADDLRYGQDLAGQIDRSVADRDGSHWSIGHESPPSVVYAGNVSPKLDRPTAGVTRGRRPTTGR